MLYHKNVLLQKTISYLWRRCRILYLGHTFCGRGV